MRGARVLCALVALSAAGAALGSVRSAGGDAYYEYLQGKIQRYSGDLAGAAEHLSQAAGVDDSSAIHTELAETYLRMGEIQKAIDQARIGTEKDPSSIAARKMLVGAYLAQAQRSTDRSAPTAAAIAEMKKLVELAPGDIDMRISLGRLLLDTRPEEAIEQFRAARELGGDPQQLGMLIARSLMSEGRTQDAEAELQGILAVSPSSEEALTALAQLAEDRDDWDGAAGYYRRLLQGRAPDGDLRTRLGYTLVQAGRADEAVTELREACSANPQDRKARELLVRALRAAHRPGEALHELSVLLEYRPDDPMLLMQAGRIHEERAEEEQALEFYRRAAAAAAGKPAGAPDALDANGIGALTLARAAIELQLADPQAALRTLAGVPEDASDFGADAASLRVRALSAAGRGGEAAEAAGRLIGSSPKDPRGPLLLFEARLVGASRAGAARALEEFRPASRSPRELVTAADTLRRAGFGSMGVALLEKAVEAHPQDASLLFSLGGLQGQLGAARKADAIMERVLVLDPNDSRAQNYLGYSLAERGKDLPRAEALIRKALASEPSSAAYIDSLGWVLYKAGRLEEAGVALERAADMMAGDATVREHLGDLYRKKGPVDRAIGEWKAALALRPEDPGRLRRKILDASREQR